MVRRARTVAVYGDDDPAALAALLGQCRRLRAAAAEAGTTLRDDAMSLGELDGQLRVWRDTSDLRPWLAAEVGQYLGTVLVKEVPGARWVRERAGLPVVRLADGADIDVIAVAAERVARPNADLRGVVREVSARPLRKRRRWQRVRGG